MVVVDFHTHILPGIDDGSRDVQTSLKLLYQSFKADIGCVYLTPHFYPDEQNVEEFTSSRRDSVDSLRRALPEHLRDALMSHLRVGAEVAYFDGISCSEHLSELTMQGMKRQCLMIEMPYCTWDDDVISEITALSDKGYLLIFAHIERFISRANKVYIRELFDMSSERDIVFQINAESFTESEHRAKKLLKMLEREGIRFVLGSDCHSLNRRPQNLGEARAVIAGFDEEMLIKIDRLSNEIIQ